MGLPRRSLLGWLVTVVSTTTTYALFFNGEFADGGVLPVWLPAASWAAAAAVFGYVLWWQNRTGGGVVPDLAMRDYQGIHAVVLAATIVGEVLTVGVEIGLRAPAVWMAPPISTLAYSAGALWLHWRYYRQLTR